jgi:hypothetical protein
VPSIASGLLPAIIQFILDDKEAEAVVHRLVDALPSGSYVVVSHATNEVGTEVMDAHQAHWNAHGTPKFLLPLPANYRQGLRFNAPRAVS